MANSLDASGIRSATASIQTKGIERWLLPSLSDCLFLAVLAWLFATGSGGWVGLLADGDTGWHIRTGEWILDHGTVPKVDLFSFSRAGQPWYAWEWLSDVLYALLHRMAALKGVVLFSALLLSGFGTILFRHLIWRGTTVFAALLVTLMVFGASTIHFLARPHIFTLLGMTIAMWLIDADRRKPSNRIWLLIPICVLWVNLHGGFLALIACLGLLIIGTSIEEALNYWVDAKQPNVSAIRRYCALTAGCAAVTLINPYGWNLHLHVVEYLQSSFIKDYVQEFQSPIFRTESVMHFEALLFLGLISCGWLLWTRQIVPALWILFWAHNSLLSVRHVPLFMIIAAPWVAAGLTELWSNWVEPADRKSYRGIFASIARDTVRGCNRTSVWIGVVCLCFILLPEPTIRWPKDFPDLKFPARIVSDFKTQLTSGRLLTMDQWGDYLIYHNYPQQRVFIDGRSDFFGKDIGREYVRMMQGQWDWDVLLEKYQFDRVLSPLEWPLTALLKKDPRWRILKDDGSAVLFEHTGVTKVASVPTRDEVLSSEKKAHLSSNENPRPSRN